jgi:hypothetical protein
MRSRLRLVLLASPWLVSPGLTAKAADAPPRRRRFDPGLGAISPEGRSVAFVEPAGSGLRVVVRSFEGERGVLQADVGRISPRGLVWADEQRLFLVFPAGAPLGAAILDVPSHRLTPMSQPVLGEPVVRRLGGRPTLFLQAAPPLGRGPIRLLALALDPPALRLAAPAEPGARHWVVGLDGQAVAVELYDADAGRWTLRVRGPQGWRDAVSAQSPAAARRVLGLARDGHGVVYAVRAPDAGWSWREARLDAAPPAQPLRVAADTMPLLDPQDGRVIGYVAGEDLVFFSPDEEGIWRSVKESIRSRPLRLVSWSGDHRRILFVAGRPDGSPGLLQLDLAARRGEWLSP